MSPIPQLSATQLHHAAEIQTKIEALQAELARLLYGTSAPAENRTRSSAGRARTIAGSKAYWARRRAAAKPTKAKSVTAAPAKRRTISPAGRRKLAASATARWAKAKAAGDDSSDEEESAGTFQVKGEQGIVTNDARALARDLVRLGVPASNVNTVIRTVAQPMGITVEGNISDRTVRRVVLEGGIAAQVQVVDEVHRAESA